MSGIHSLTKAASETVEAILGTIEGQVYIGANGDAIILTGDADGGTVIEVDEAGHTSEASVNEWSTGWEA